MMMLPLIALLLLSGTGAWSADGPPSFQLTLGAVGSLA